MSEHSHRPSTGLKQSNKRHRDSSKADSRDAKKAQATGRTARTPLKPTQQAGSHSKAARRNHAKQLQQARRHASTRNNRSLDSPRVVVCLSLTQDIDAHATLQEVFGAHELASLGTLRIANIVSSQQIHMQLVLTPMHDFYTTLDVCAVADYILLFLSPTVEVRMQSETILRSLCALGVPENGIRGIVCGKADITPDIRRSLLSYAQHFFGSSVTRLYAASDSGEASNLLRSLCEATLKGVSWREGRGRMLAETIEWRNDHRELRLTGVVRGSNFSVSRLVHLPGIGDCQLDKILDASASTSPQAAMDVDGPTDLVLTQCANLDADDLQSLNTIDPLDALQNEQTWPTEEEMKTSYEEHTDPSMSDTLDGTAPAAVKQLPRGTSQYQAAWILEETEGSDTSSGKLPIRERSFTIDAEEDGIDLISEPDSDEKRSAHGKSGLHLDDDNGKELDLALLEKDRQQWHMARDDERFPDEIDTPMHVPARQRFARYRGLRSFRSTPWDPYENLPSDYARIFMFRDWSSTGRGAAKLEAADNNAVQAGARVTLVIRIPETVLHLRLPSPQTVWSLHRHEHKISVAHCTILRNTHFTEDVRSKDSLVLQVGPRRYTVYPLFSHHNQANSGKGTNNVHKFERFLPKDQGGAPSVASTYMPVTFGTTVPSLFFREAGRSCQPELIGSGTLHSCDPTRIIAKRIVLTGHPIKVHKRTATIRHLFFNPEDVAYFKPVQLHTKKGRIGFIKESLGTHGLLKAGFNGPLQQTDTVCLCLYKRVFPKWSEPHSLSEKSQNLEPKSVDG